MLLNFAPPLGCGHLPAFTFTWTVGWKPEFLLSPQIPRAPEGWSRSWDGPNSRGMHSHGRGSGTNPSGNLQYLWTEQLPGDVGRSLGCGDAASPTFPRLNPSAWQVRGGKTNPQTREEGELTQAVKLNEALKSETRRAAGQMSWMLRAQLWSSAQQLYLHLDLGTTLGSGTELQVLQGSSSLLSRWALRCTKSQLHPCEVAACSSQLQAGTWEPCRSCRASLALPRSSPRPGEGSGSLFPTLLPVRRSREHGKASSLVFPAPCVIPRCCQRSSPGTAPAHHAQADPVTSAGTPATLHPHPKPPTPSQELCLPDSEAVPTFSLLNPRLLVQTPQTPMRNTLSRESSAPGCKQPPPQ